MEGLRCGSYNYLILFNLQRREYCQKVYPLIHLLTPISRTNETIPLKFPALLPTRPSLRMFCLSGSAPVTCDMKRRRNHGIHRKQFVSPRSRRGA